jgi:SsrA-binding protein
MEARGAAAADNRGDYSYTAAPGIMMAGSGQKVISNNRKAGFNFELFDRVEAGIVLTGTEVKSLREGRINFGDAYCIVEPNEEMFLVDAHISTYAHGNQHNHEPLRRRKLLLHKEEIRRMHQKVRERGLTIVPTRMYFVRGRVKLEIALAKGKKVHDKREAIKQRDADRESQRDLVSY